jgi:hypothetical protein
MTIRYSNYSLFKNILLYKYTTIGMPLYILTCLLAGIRFLFPTIISKECSFLSPWIGYIKEHSRATSAFIKIKFVGNKLTLKIAITAPGSTRITKKGTEDGIGNTIRKK